METKSFYKLPPLSYEYDALEPFMSEEQLKLHHDKHHQAYVNAVNADFEMLEKSRKESSEIDMKAILKNLSFNYGGHVLHTLFWNTLISPKEAMQEPGANLMAVINNEFGSFERFKMEFTKTALSVEGSGWAALCYSKQAGRPILMQIEKHNNNISPQLRVIMVLDMFEHAYYIDYKNDKAKYVEAFWNIVNWEEVSVRCEKIKNK